MSEREQSWSDGDEWRDWIMFCRETANSWLARIPVAARKSMFHVMRNHYVARIAELEAQNAALVQRVARLRLGIRKQLDQGWLPVALGDLLAADDQAAKRERSEA